MDFQKKVLTYCQMHQLIAKQDKIVIGISGGADSVCLFLMLDYMKKIFNIKIFALHVNHQLRGDEANEDEAFVKQLCKTYQIPLKIVSKPVEKLARQNRQSTEEAGRELRYKAMEGYRQEVGANKIAVAHHKNDQAETILYHLCRGSGLEGLAGMQPQRDKIIRPLLSVTRDEIEQYLKKQQQPFRIDSTNLENIYTRNKLRNQVIPFLQKEVNKQTVAHISASAELLEEAASYIAKNGEKAFRNMTEEKMSDSKQIIKLKLDVFDDEAVVIQKWVIKKVLSDLAGHSKNLEHQHVLDVIALIKKQVGKKINLPYNIVAWKDYNYILFEKKNEKTFSGNNIQLQEREISCWQKGILFDDAHYNVEESVVLVEKQKKKEKNGDCLERESMTENTNGNIEYKRESFEKINIEQNGQKFSIRLLDIKKLGWNIQEKLEKIPKNNCTKWFDYDKIVSTVIFRKIQDGDYLQIDEEGHHKSIKKVLKDGKISARDREHIWVFAEEHHILWVPGLRSSEYYKIGEETDYILEVSMHEEEKL